MSTVMKISEAASLALHTMGLLADDIARPMSAKEIAATLQVSEAHLAKVLQRLARVGLVRSERGPRGGFTIARAGDQITLLEVYEAIEGPLTESTCLLGKRICDGRDCILGDLLDRLNTEAREYLSRTRLTDVTNVYKNIPLDRVNHA